ncbi:MAG TPA: TlpA disulfide reductase family protein [Polyangia bacterium]|jgi:thiol-disulfide isomerase/thioredoxin|nr:TlpA disulfide reductase family protein [Polyangia bacterium]
MKLDRRPSRSPVFFLIGSLCALLAGASESAARGRTPLSPGLWRAWLESPGGELPFGVELQEDKGGWRAFILNPPERLAVARVTLEKEKGQLLFDMAPYDSTVRATLGADGQSLDGTWRKRRDAKTWVEMPFHARRSAGGEARRFQADPAAAGVPAATLAERWAVTFSSDKDPAVAILATQAPDRVTGTFLTATGDYRYLAGNLDGGRLRLSCFDGAHAFLFDARLEPARGAAGAAAAPTLRGDFWSSDRWHETWVAQPDPRAALADTFAQNRWNDGVALADVKFPDLKGQMRSLADPAFGGKARILQVFGSWCPNCNDEAAYLVELDRRYRGRGLSILGLAFEATGELQRDTEQVRRFAAHHHVEYPVLVAGLSDKEQASKTFPLLDRVRAYPTTIFLHADGRLRAIHTGFAGPATGEEHRQLRRQFEAIIEELLAETPSARR